MYIADTGNHCVRVISGGIIDTFAGQCGVPADEHATNGDEAHGVAPRDAKLHKPFGIDVAADGTVYIADTHTQTIRVVRP